MSNVVKLPDNILKELKELGNIYLDIMSKVGDAEIQINNLNKIKNDLLLQYNENRKKEDELINSIGTKYGYGKINLKTGEINIENTSKS